MPVLNSGLIAGKWESDFLDCNSGTPVDGTWYTVTDYSGMGRIFGIGIAATSTALTAEIRVTTDGEATTLSKTNMGDILTMTANYIPLHIEFESSLLVEVRRDGDTNGLKAWVNYGIFSEEIKREIIPAFTPIPRAGALNPETLELYDLAEPMVRPVQYAFPVMLIWFRGSKGVSNKLVMPQGEKVDILIQPDGSYLGVLRESAFDTTLKGPRYQWQKAVKNKDKIVDIEGKKYIVSFTNGDMVSNKIPKKTSTVTDAR